MPFPDLPPERIPGSPGHLNDHQLIDQALDYVKQAGYRDDPDFPPLPDVPVLGQSGHVTAHDRILAVLEYVKANPAGMGWAQVSNNPTGTYKGDDGHTYAYYEFTADGTLTVTAAGVLDVLLVGGGHGFIDQWAGGGDLDKASGGGGGCYPALIQLPSGACPVQVGAGGSASNYPWGPARGGESSVGVYSSPLGTDYAVSVPAPYFTSSITGTSETYAGSGQASSTGHGDGGRGQGVPGNPGVVIAKTRLN